MNTEHTAPGMSLIVKTVTHWLQAFIILFGAYVALYGHVSPGGGFAGGVIIACAFILLTLAEGKEVSRKVLSHQVAGKLCVLGLLLFLGIGLSGIIWGRAFLHNFISHDAGVSPELLSGGIIEICEIAIAMIVSMSLFLAFSALSALHVAPEGRARRVAKKEE